jgi:hypothetical protein
MVILAVKVIALWALNAVFALGAIYLFVLFVVVASRDWVEATRNSGQ